jgi:hypothetical protein
MQNAFQRIPLQTRRVQHLFIRAANIAVLSKTGLTIDHVEKVMDAVWSKPEKQDDVASEIADVRIALTGIASDSGVNEIRAMKTLSRAGVTAFTQQRPVQNGDETQTSVTSWIRESFPGATLNRRIKHLFEEVTELARAMGNVGWNPALDTTKAAWEIAECRSTCMSAEIAGFRASLSAIATDHGICEQDALNTVMARNRARSLAERQAREAAKPDAFRA